MKIKDIEKKIEQVKKAYFKAIELGNQKMIDRLGIELEELSYEWEDRKSKEDL